MSSSHTIRAAVPNDFAGIAALLADVELPFDDISPTLDGFFVAERGASILGTIGLERYGNAALVRSVAVHSDARGTGLGGALVARAINAARTDGIRDLYLLTTTAADWAPRFGFTLIPRDQVNEAVRQSPQFLGGTCTSAVAMHLGLTY
ncbi:MAG: arsenic resistance N-acetyltransferase ArsN2 [Gemmatimonadetes bacterium]|nr:arsenic resistance N-acetyltransferase ArsN2 [Gemmatimonadota bacterium]